MNAVNKLKAIFQKWKSEEDSASIFEREWKKMSPGQQESFRREMMREAKIDKRQDGRDAKRQARKEAARQHKAERKEEELKRSLMEAKPAWVGAPIVPVPQPPKIDLRKDESAKVKEKNDFLNAATNDFLNAATSLGITCKIGLQAYTNSYNSATDYTFIAGEGHNHFIFEHNTWFKLVNFDFTPDTSTWVAKSAAELEANFNVFLTHTGSYTNTIVYLYFLNGVLINVSWEIPGVGGESGGY